MNKTSATQFNRTLTLVPLVILGLAYMAPTTIFSTYGVAAQVTHGMVPAAYVCALIAMLFTAYSYGKMAQVYPISGSAYTYTQKSINPHLGFIVGWAVLLDYLFLPMINFLLGGIFLSTAFPAIPSWVWIIAFIIVNTAINIIGIQMTARVNAALVTFQFLVTILFIVLASKGIANGIGMGTFLSALPFYNPEVPYSFVLAGASILCLSFLGFDAVTTLSEETINPRKTVPKAIFIVAFTGGLLFIFVSYIAQLVYPDFHSFQNADSASFEIANVIGGPVFGSILLAGIITAAISSGISSHASAARLLFAMGRESMLPKSWFGYIHPKYKTPTRNILLIGVFSLSALTVDLVTAASFINFGALVAFTFVNISVIFHYYIRNQKRGISGTFLYVLLPLLGAGFTFWLWTSLDKKSVILGSVWVFIGLLYLLFITKLFTKKPPEFDFDENHLSEELSGYTA